MPSISSGAFCFSHERNSQFSSSCSRERLWILDRSVSISGLLSSVRFDGFIPASLGMVPLLHDYSRDSIRIGLQRVRFFGSAQEFVETRLSGCFLKNDASWFYVFEAQ